MNVLKKEVQDKKKSIKKSTKKTTTKKIKSDDKPYLSVVVPCYNSSKSIERLLDSIVNQEGYDKTLEVIIQDDDHTDGYLDIVEGYRKKYPKLNLKVFHNKEREIHCPGNTRLDGMEHATGEWITFIDHDDLFETNAFKIFADAVTETAPETMVVTKFRDFDYKKQEYGQEFSKNNITWLHGKFYNRAFLDQYNIRFKENTESHEDLWFNQSVFSRIRLQNLRFTMVEEFTYKWVNNDDSTSRKVYENGMVYIDKYYKDYIECSITPWLNAMGENPGLAEDVFKRMCYTLLFAYFYYQSFLYRRHFEHYRPNRDIFEDTLNLVKTRFGATIDDIARVVYSDPDLYNKIRSECFRGGRTIVEAESFYNFLERFG